MLMCTQVGRDGSFTTGGCTRINRDSTLEFVHATARPPLSYILGRWPQPPVSTPLRVWQQSTIRATTSFNPKAIHSAVTDSQLDPCVHPCPATTSTKPAQQHTTCLSRSYRLSLMATSPAVSSATPKLSAPFPRRTNTTGALLSHISTRISKFTNMTLKRHCDCSSRC